MPDRTETAKLKICLVGDEGVGKSALIRRFVLSEFSEKYARTVGVVVHKRIVFVPVEGTVHTASIAVWDVIGKEEFVSRYRDAFFSGASGVLAVCDLTRPETLDSLVRWLERVRAVAGDVPAVVLANKRDLREHVRVDEDDLLAVCELYGVPYLETSAKTGENVETAFGALAAMAIRKALGRSPRPVPESLPMQEAT